ncbi:MAG: DUF4401 domain-containing protein [Myxococcales bacterium]|nr:DUF4401 domain-containing protein [Myxococcales bacterium]
MIVLRDSLRTVLARTMGDDEALLHQARDLVAEHQGAPVWYVRGFTGFVAWLSAVLLVGFLVLADIADDEWGALFVGGVLMVGAAVGRAAALAEESTFVNQLTLALVVAGEILATMGLAGILEAEAAAFLATSVLMAVMVVAFADPVHRFGATVAAGAFAGLFLFQLDDAIPLHLGATPLFAAGTALFLWEARLEAGPAASLRAPVAFGCVVGAFLLVMMGLWGPDEQRALTPWTGMGLTAVTLVGLGWSAVSEIGDVEQRAVGIAVAVVLALGAITVTTPGVVAALGTLLLAFHRRNPILFGLGTVFLTVFLTWFYYDLALSLWVKSGVLVGSGALLLGARWVLVSTMEEAQ